MYRVLFFSDLHLASFDEDFIRALRMIDDGLTWDADHIVFGGDTVDACQFEVFEELVRQLKIRKWFSADKMTIVPGNHDIYPISSRSIPKISTPNENFATFLKIVAPCCEGKNSHKLLSTSSYLFGKILAPGIVLAALDSTREDHYNPNQWTAGEIQQQHMEKVTEFFGKHKKCLHRILVVHHYPWYEGNSEWKLFFPSDIVEPPPTLLRQWMEDSLATYVLCGHIHDIKTKQLSRNCRALRMGVSGEMNEYKSKNGERIRAYYVLDFLDNGRVNLIPREFTDSQLDRLF